MKTPEEIKTIIENRIVELNSADSEFCKKRWDMSLTANERGLYRGFSNEVTFARQELQRLLKAIE